MQAKWLKRVSVAGCVAALAALAPACTKQAEGPGGQQGPGATAKQGGTGPGLLGPGAQGTGAEPEESHAQITTDDAKTGTGGGGSAGLTPDAGTGMNAPRGTGTPGAGFGDGHSGNLETTTSPAGTTP